MDARQLEVAHVKDFLSYLTVERQVSASSQNQAFNALLFLFRHVLGREFGKVDGVVRAKRRPYIPMVLSRGEVDAVIQKLDCPYDLVVKLLYGCGLRMFECLKLRVQDINFDMGTVTVHDGKGKKDRNLPLPESLVNELRVQIDRVADLHKQDLNEGFAGVFLPGALATKYRGAAKEFYWQWLFPAKTLTLVEKERAKRRYHLHESHVSKAIKKAVSRACIPKRLPLTPSPQLCQSPSDGRLRYPHYPGAFGPQRCAYNDDLYAYHTCSGAQGEGESIGYKYSLSVFLTIVVGQREGNESQLRRHMQKVFKALGICFSLFYRSHQGASGIITVAAVAEFAVAKELPQIPETHLQLLPAQFAEAEAAYSG